MRDVRDYHRVATDRVVRMRDYHPVEDYHPVTTVVSVMPFLTSDLSPLVFPAVISMTLLSIVCQALTLRGRVPPSPMLL